VNINRISLDDLSSKVSNRLEILKSLYKKTNDEKVLKVLVDELLSNYQFDEVRSYMSDVDIFTSSVIDKQSYIYTYINTLAITDPNSMKNFISFIEQMKAKNLISSDEFLFYK
jgi:PIN domain nuclease of toxin-antitoxin system